MQFSNPWAEPGFFVKAHLHTHTTESDGKLPPEQVATVHHRCGYSVLAITDHGKVTDTARLARPDLVMIPGVELGCRASEEVFYHVVALGVRQEQLAGFGGEVKECLRQIAEAGGLAFIAHPYWSSNTAADLLGLPNCLGVEVYNHGCEIEIGKGISSVHWDDCLRRGERYVPFAVDDAHMYGFDVLGGWTMIKVRALTAEAAMDSIRRGLIYATMGPQIIDLRIEDRLITVETSPANAIRFMCDDQQGWCEQAWGRPPITTARWEMSGRERYVRVEVVDEAGRRAWSPAMYP